MRRDFEPIWMIDPAGNWWVKIGDEQPTQLIEPEASAEVIKFPANQTRRKHPDVALRVR